MRNKSSRKLTIQQFQIEALLFHILFRIQDSSTRCNRAENQTSQIALHALNAHELSYKDVI